VSRDRGYKDLAVELIEVGIGPRDAGGAAGRVV
jgi:hypothetical protein